MTRSLRSPGLRLRLLLPLLAALSLPAPGRAEGLPERPEVRAFVDRMAASHGFPREQLLDWFSRVRIREDILRAISNPAEAKPWHEYRQIFLTPDRIRGGAQFMRAHRPALQRAEATYGVPPEIVTAIMGVETRYGRYKGRYPVFEALSTLAFAYPRRSRFFAGELEQFLLLTREEGLDPLGVKGSYAGAMGGPQFISSSFRGYAVDFDGDGHRDLWTDPDDMIGSIAHYFARHGWRRGEPVAVPAQVSGDGAAGLLALGLRPQRTVAELVAAGVRPGTAVPGELPAALIALEGAGGTEYWLGFTNFYVITRYNHSPLYAMAVYQLSREILAAARPRAARDEAAG